jgi:osmotically-inducible protein OsmY
VVPPAAREAVDAKDKDIAKAVTLTGQVATIVASAKASEMARGVPGVKSVKNELAS